MKVLEKCNEKGLGKNRMDWRILMEGGDVVRGQLCLKKQWNTFRSRPTAYQSLESEESS
jgi:hypothetical protein